MTKDEIVEKAGGYLNVGRYLNEHPDDLKEFLSNSFNTDDLRNFANTYLADFNHLYSMVMERISYLNILGSFALI